MANEAGGGGGILDATEKAALVVNPLKKAEVCVGAEVVVA
jgi:hypothetical protein